MSGRCTAPNTEAHFKMARELLLGATGLPFLPSVAVTHFGSVSISPSPAGWEVTEALASRSRSASRETPSHTRVMP